MAIKLVSLSMESRRDSLSLHETRLELELRFSLTTESRFDSLSLFRLDYILSMRIGWTLSMETRLDSSPVDFPH